MCPMNPRLLRPLARSGDSDVRNYIAAVEAADTEPLEQAVKDAYRDFIVGCKSDGIWDAIKASCILAGARTLAGALVPLKGSAPTNNGPFVSGDYDRETGLVGNGSTKYLNSNRLSDADPQDNQHLAVYVSQAPTAAAFAAHIGTGGGNNGATVINATIASNTMSFRSRTITGNSGPAGSLSAVGPVAISRSSSAGYSRLLSSVVTSITQASQTPIDRNTFVFASASVGSGVNLNTHSDARLAFYSIGESLDLALLDTRLSALIAAIGAAI